jgi:hypothetical protein
MGAQLWYHRAPWHDRPADALRELQAKFLAENYDLPQLIQQHLNGARQTVAATEAEGDPYDLLDLWRAQLALVEKVASRPVPEGPQVRIKLIRRICAPSGEGIGNVLDVKGVSRRGGILITRRLPAKQIVELVGTDQPTEEEAQAAVGRINEQLRRAESVCFPIYADTDRATPVGWYFVGNTID